MKSRLFTALFVSSIFFSCSTDDALTGSTFATPQSITTGTTLQRTPGPGPENTANTFDYAGSLHNEILISTVAAAPGTVLSTIILAVDTAAQANTSYMAKAGTYTAPDPLRVQWVIANSASAATIVNNSSASVTGKQKLLDFLTLAASVESSSYTTAYTTIVGFEAGIISSTTLSGSDKQIILTTTAVARYSLYYKDDKDKDWKGLKTGLYGAITGSSANVPTAITMAVVCGLGG